MSLIKKLQILTKIGRNFSSKTLKNNKIIQSGPDLKHFLNVANTKPEQEANNNIDPHIDIENRIFLQNLKTLDQQNDDSDDPNVKPILRKYVYFEIHGCQMNVNDTEVAYSILDSTGNYIRCESDKDADVILIMTCSIRENAEQKIWNRLKDFRHEKKKRPNLQIGLLGCMAERLKDKIVHQEKIVDVVCGPDSYRLLPSLLEQSSQSGRAAMNVQLSMDETYAEISPLRINPKEKKAFVSIQRGCDNMCSFCIVPFVRGRERSRSISSILDEIKRLSDSGIREITLLGQNVNSYCDTSIQPSTSSTTTTSHQLSKGFKTIYKPKVGNRFTDLLDAVSRIDPEMRVRFTSPHPKDFPDDLLQLMQDRPNICKSIHLPAQSGSSSCLERMRRGYTREAYLSLVEKIKAILPSVSLTSDFIAGFCGETEEEHFQTISLMSHVGYTYCFMYAYSMREKTRAFHRLADDVPAEIKARRYGEMLETFRRTSTQLNKSKVGQTHLVLVDQVSKRSVNDFSGRNDNNSLVIFENREIPCLEESEHSSSVRRPQIGDYVACKLLSATSQSFKAEPLFICKLQTFHKLNKIKTL